MNEKNNKLLIEIEPSNGYALTSGETRMYLLIKLVAPEIKPVEGRVPFNLGVVLDRSGSMRGHKIQKAKNAVKFIVENLQKTDIFSLVIYDDIIDVVVPSEKVTDRFAIIRRLDQITARGTTNLHSGMLEGAKQIALNKGLEYKNIMFLLSDGLANAGISDRTQIATESKRINTSHGITISTFGIGDDFDEDMMVGIADAASGEFYFIENADDIPKFIEKEFQGLLQTVASSIKIDNLTLAPGVRLNRVLGVAYEDKDKSFHDLGDLRSSGEKIVILDLNIPSGIDGSKTKIITFEISYIDSNLNRVSHSESFDITYTNNEDLLASENQKILDYVTLLETAYIREEAIMLADRGNFEQAQSILNTQQTKLKQRAGMSGSLAQLSDVMTQNEEFLQSKLQRQTYTKLARKQMKSSSYNLRKQRKQP